MLTTTLNKPIATDRPGETVQIVALWNEKESGISEHMLDMWFVQGSTRHWAERHEGWTLALLADDEISCSWNHDGVTKTTTGGGLMLMDPGSVHVTTQVIAPECGADFSLLKIDEEIVRRAARERGLRAAPRIKRARGSQPDDLPLRQALRGLALSVRHSSPLQVELAFEQLVGCLLSVCEEPLPVSRRFAIGHPKLRRVREMLEDESIERLSLGEIAKEVGLSRYHLTRAFGAAFGTSPTSLVEIVRMSLARRRLEEGCTVTQVARDLGFSRSYFNRRYRRNYGTAPGSWARTRLKSR